MVASGRLVALVAGIWGLWLASPTFSAGGPPPVVSLQKSEGKKPATRPSGPAVTGSVEAPRDAGEISVAFFDHAEGPGPGGEPLHSVKVGPGGKFEAHLENGRAYQVVPIDAARRLIPRKRAIVGFGEAAWPAVDSNDWHEGMDRSVDFGGAVTEIRRAGNDEVVKVSLALAQPGTLHATVRDEAGGPVAGLEIRIWQAGEMHAGEKPIGGGRTLEDGSITAGPLVGRFDVRVWAKDGRVADEEVIVDPGATTKVEIALSQGGPLQGKVLDAEGKPVVGGRVYLVPEIASGDFEGRLLGGSAPPGRPAVTGEDGAFKFPATLKPEDYVLLVDAEGYSVARSPVVRPGGPGSTAIQLVLGRAILLHGRVVDPDGKGVETTVRLEREGVESGPMSARVESNAEGSFEVPRIEPGNWVLWVNERGFVLAERKIRVAPGAAAVEIRLARAGRTIRGRLLGKDGHPLPDGVSAEERGEPQVQVMPITDVALWLLERDPKAKGGPVAEGEDATFCFANPVDGTFSVPTGEGRRWLGLVVAGKVEEIREVGAKGEAEFRVDLETIEKDLGALFLLVRDAGTGRELERADLKHARTPLPTIIRRGFHRPVYGPIRAGKYDFVVSADGYKPKTISGVEVLRRQVGGPIEVRLDRTK